MKRTLLATAALLMTFTGSATAQLTTFEGPRAELVSGTTAADLITLSRNAKNSGPNAIVDRPQTSVLVPAAARVQGLFDTYFLSEVAIVNYRNASQIVTFAWLEQGVASCGTPVQQLEMPPLSIARYADFVGIALGREGVGAVLVVARTAQGAVDAEGRIDVVSRIYTTQPGSTGTTSQSLPTVRPDDVVGMASVSAPLMRHDENFRTNVGIVNLGLDGAAHSWRVLAQGQAGATATNLVVPPCSMVQAPLPAVNFGPVAVTVTSLDASLSTAWTAYAVSLDNRTGDGWVVHGVAP